MCVFGKHALEVLLDGQLGASVEVDYLQGGFETEDSASLVATC